MGGSRTFDLVVRIAPVVFGQRVPLPDIGNADSIKGISFELKKEVNNLFGLLAAEVSGKPHLSLIISDNLVKEKNYDASKIIRELAKEIQGGGGGQPFYATAGGKNTAGIDASLEKGKKLVMEN